MNWLPTELELRLGAAMVPEAEILPQDNRESRRLYKQARAVLADIVGDGVTERHPDGVRRRNNLHATFQVLQHGK